MASTYSQDALKVLSLLRERHNVLLSGPPAVGKSLLLNEVAAAFAGIGPSQTSNKPIFDPKAAVPIPDKAATDIPPELQSVLPSPDRSDRKVFRTVFHQSSKHRDFITGIAPDLAVGKTGSFKVVQGTLYRASEHAKNAKGASLLIIDEINRGPAVQMFGGAIVAMEGEKRLLSDGKPGLNTQFFELLSPGGEIVEYAFPEQLYILGAMNQADVSVEPLDVAFLRRWSHYGLEPSGTILREYLGLPKAEVPIATNAANAGEVYEAAVQAWTKVNARISLGRGREFRIGHGVLMVAVGKPPSTLEGALHHVTTCWTSIRAHIDEVFFGDLRGVAATLNALSAIPGHPYKLEEVFFADDPREQLVGPAQISPADIFALLRAVSS